MQVQLATGAEAPAFATHPKTPWDGLPEQQTQYLSSPKPRRLSALASPTQGSGRPVAVSLRPGVRIKTERHAIRFYDPHKWSTFSVEVTTGPLKT